MNLYEKNGSILYILNVLKKYTDEAHKLSITSKNDSVTIDHDVTILLTAKTVNSPYYSL